MKAHIEKIWGWDLTWQQKDFDKNLAIYTTCFLLSSKKTVGYIQYQVKERKCYVNMIIIEPPYQSKGLGVEVFNSLFSDNTLIPI